MSNELQTLNERIAERIGKDLVELIPADQWQAIVDREVEKFKLTVAPKIIQELLKAAYMDKAKTELTRLTSSQEWDAQTGDQIYSELQKFIGDSAGTIFAGMLTPAMQMVLQDLRTRLGY